MLLGSINRCLLMRAGRPATHGGGATSTTVPCALSPNTQRYRPMRHDIPTAEVSWNYETRLGKCTQNEENYVGTTESVISTRGFKRLPESDRYQVDYLNKAFGTTWHTGGPEADYPLLSYRVVLRSREIGRRLRRRTTNRRHDEYSLRTRRPANHRIHFPTITATLASRSTTGRSDFLIGATSCNMKPSPMDPLSRVSVALTRAPKDIESLLNPAVQGRDLQRGGD